MIKNHPFLAIVIAASLAMPFSSVNSAMLTIANPSFEVNPQINGVPDGWSTYSEGPGPTTFFVGTYPPGVKEGGVDDFYNPPGPGGVPVPPDGDNVGWVFLDETFGTGAVGFQQTLNSTLMANSRYDLSTAVGNPQSAFSPRSLQFFNFDGFPGYIIQLLAGDTVIAEDINSTSIAEGDFAIVSLSLTIGPSHNLLGQALGIRLLNMNMDLSEQFTADWNSEVDFDDVQLAVSAIPIPGAVWLFGTALIGLVGFSKRRKAV